MSIESTPPIELLTIPEVAKVLKISESGVRRLQQARHLPFIKVGGSIRFYKEDIMSYLEQRRVDSIDLNRRYDSTNDKKGVVDRFQIQPHKIQKKKS
jgi:excisionase family DNA binding protein